MMMQERTSLHKRAIKHALSIACQGSSMHQYLNTAYKEVADYIHKLLLPIVPSRRTYGSRQNCASQTCAMLDANGSTPKDTYLQMGAC
eukprot:7452001-Prorocentrum_lima.AAC.1